MVHIVGFGEYVVSNNPADVLKTFALGSCIGITMYCKKPFAMGMAHIVLPVSPLESNFKKNPGHFADTAIEAMLSKMCTVYGCKPSDLEIKLFGGSQTFSGNRILSIGQQNYHAVKRILAAHRLSWDAAEVGGTWSRTIFLDGRDGMVNVTRYDLNDQLALINGSRKVV